jgi:hypothetical protein
MSRFTHISAPQRTDAWRQARAGRATASRASDWHAKVKSGESASRRNYRTQLATERLTGMPLDSDFISPAMQRGIDLEPAARNAYEALTGQIVRETGFLLLEGIAAGCSLDGHLGDFETVVQLKCPSPATHSTYWRESRFPPDYQWQAAHELWVCGAQHYHFASYCPEFPEELQLFLVECDRSEFDISGHEAETVKFLEEVDREVDMLRNAKNPWAIHATLVHKAAG